jgi:DNA adenine methylase
MAIEQARPFVKWAGGKSKLVPQILARVPAIWNRETDLYLEPFLGGGAVFFALQPEKAILNDRNFQLMSLYHNVQRNLTKFWDAFVRVQAPYNGNPEVTYAAVRGNYNGDLRLCPGHSDVNQAARLLFLNKTCFNGIYRVNSSGQFNVPWGKNPNVGFPTLEHLQCCSTVLQDAQLLSHNFADPEIAKLDVKGALIYCDPPYMPVSGTADFTSYTADGFGYVCQLHLAVQAAYWRGEGAHVILSQSADESLVDQYRRLGFRADLVQAARAINSKGDGRGPVGEYIIY